MASISFAIDGTTLLMLGAVAVVVLGLIAALIMMAR
jgi:hypothetical protein